ncbi:MAG TPA: hypothetical protein VHG71_12990 [Verrucomicrobiae bacterium]|nr:hypothetical protein [Verrucomicrobiae bacterium]
MKRCSYCGAGYPDDTMVCAVDQTPLEQSRLAEAPAVVSMIRRKIPLPLSIVSCYLVASGIFQIGWSILIAPYLGSIPILNVVYGVLILVVCRGLRRCSRHWYVCALVIIGVVLSAICFEIVRGFMHSVPFHFTILYLKDFAIWLCIILVLTRSAIRGLFFHEPEIAT